MSDNQNQQNQNLYKETLNLPETPFPMKANLPQREPEILKKWDDLKLYELLEQQHGKKPKFILNDGPPFANGAIHLGHAVNKVLKDIVVKARRFSGFAAPFVPGWDCHGLPIEINVEKKFGKPGQKLDAKAFREECRKYVETQIAAQKASFIRLGVLGDWKNPYKTMDFKYEADIIRSLAKIVENGHVHKGLKPVHWCIDCGSALAEAEVEYKMKTSPAIDVCFKVVDRTVLEKALGKGIQQSSLPALPDEIYAVIWTTTPWTLPANEAVAVHPELDYVVVTGDSQNISGACFIIAKDLLESATKRMGLAHYQVLVDAIKGEVLAGIKLQHPFYDKIVPIVLGDHVTLDTGTGLVHTAPAHGQEDYILGVKYHLPQDNPVGSNGCFLSDVKLFAGKHVFKTNDEIIQTLKEKGRLLHEEEIEHSYPHCWRHKTPLIFRATPQWFIGMEEKGLRKQSIDAIKKVAWLPTWGENRMEGMLAEGRPDWCISRQRTWGVPLSFFLHKDTGNLHPDTPRLMEEVAKAVEKGGVDAWYDLDPATILKKEDLQKYEKSNDTIDVWFDSGVAHFCVLEKRSELQFPAQLYLEGSDQYRGWFQSSLLTSVAMNGSAPYEAVLTHGFVVDAEGRKMSKSLGNVDPPDQMMNTLGADVLRLWVAATDYRGEMAVSDEILKRVADTYRRIRNTARFLLANLNGFDPATHLVPLEKMIALDRWMVFRAKELQKEISIEYQNYQFHNVYQKLQNFCSIDLGSFYLDVIKDRQYTGKKDGIPRRSAQTALYYIIESLTPWIAPILSFTAEEIWAHIPGKREASVFLVEWFNRFPKGLEETQAMGSAFWKEVLGVREIVNKALEEARAEGKLGSGLEAEVALYCEPALYELLQQLEDELRFVLITSKADVFKEAQRPNDANATSLKGLWLQVNASPHPKCVRCWHRRSDVDQNKTYPGLCARCVENIGGKGELRQYA